jgi:peptide deformylase
MALLPIIKYGNPILRMKARLIESITDETLKLAGDMIQTMQANDGIGLAAPQVARSLALVVVDVGLIEKGAPAQAYINPEILEIEGSVVIEEGCLSVPEIREEVTRPERIRIKYQTIDGKLADLWIDGLLARVLQHEVDHLKGVFFVDRISGLKKKLLNKDLKKIAQEETVRNEFAV